MAKEKSKAAVLNGGAAKPKKAAAKGAAPLFSVTLHQAFHHMQRASVVVSLMEKGTGEDLRALLKRGTKLYEHALKQDGDERTIQQANGLLCAAEHLAMGGLYDARLKYRQKVSAPKDDWLMSCAQQVRDRLGRVENTKRGEGPDLFPAAEELVRQAEDVDHDPQLAYELVMAADALCVALENGL